MVVSLPKVNREINDMHYSFFCCYLNNETNKQNTLPFRFRETFPSIEDVSILDVVTWAY